MSAIRLEGKATILRAAELKRACRSAVESSGDGAVEINWAGCLGLDASVLQLLLAVAHEKRICGAGDPSDAVREALAVAGLDPSMKAATSNPG